MAESGDQVVAATALVRVPIDRATQIPPAGGEREICRCPSCGSPHWKRPEKNSG